MGWWQSLLHFFLFIASLSIRLLRSFSTACKPLKRRPRTSLFLLSIVPLINTCLAILASLNVTICPNHLTLVSSIYSSYGWPIVLLILYIFLFISRDDRILSLNISLSEFPLQKFLTPIFFFYSCSMWFYFCWVNSFFTIFKKMFDLIIESKLPFLIMLFHSVPHLSSLFPLPNNHTSLSLNHNRSVLFSTLLCYFLNFAYIFILFSAYLFTFLLHFL